MGGKKTKGKVDGKTDGKKEAPEKDTPQQDMTHLYLCVAEQGLVVPVPEGGMRTLKIGDEVDGEYYEQVAEKLPQLILKQDCSPELLADVEKARRRRTGESFPEDFKAAMDGEEREYDPRLDRGRGDAAENLRTVINETRGEQRIDDQASSRKK